MLLLTGWISKWLLQRGFTRLSSFAGPLIWLIVLVLVGGFIWWRYEAMRAEIRKEVELEITQQVTAAANARLEELTRQVKQFNEDSQRRADALDQQQRQFAANTAALLSKIRSGQKPVAVVNSQGECRITPEAARTWNQLQNLLQQP